MNKNYNRRQRKSNKVIIKKYIYKLKNNKFKIIISTIIHSKK